MRPLTRIPPKLSVHQMKSYAIASPRSTHTRPASCAEVECSGYRKGWETFVDESTDLGQRQAGYIRTRADRHYTESRNEHGITVFAFAPGQDCFGEHRVSLDRPEFYFVRDGDHRGNPTGRARKHDKPEFWVEDFAQHQDALKRASE